MKRGLKLGIGIPLVIIGFFVTLSGVVLTVMVGPDGSFRLPSLRASSDGHALLFDAIYVRSDLPTSGNFSATLGIEATGDEPVFIGIGPMEEVSAYLSGVPADRVVQVDWPGGVRTEPLPGGTASPEPPLSETFWEASESGGGTVAMDWVVREGDWTIVVMNADGGAGVDVEGTVTVTMPALGAISIVFLVFGLLVLVAGVLLTISGAKTPKVSVGAIGGVSGEPGVPRAHVAEPASGTAPPRPD